MNTQRIDCAMSSLANKSVALIGVGGAMGMASDLVRCGLGHVSVFDKDIVSKENLCRQEYDVYDIGQPKVLAAMNKLQWINPSVRVETHHIDICSYNDEQARRVFSDVDVLVAATDSHAAQARVNQIALMLDKPAVFAGLYRRGLGGDVFFWKRGLPSCYRCMFPSRYDRAGGLPIVSNGATNMDVKIVDGITTHIVIGLLTEGADNRFGKLIKQLGDRQVIQIKIDSEWNIDGSDPVRKYLGVPDGNDAYFGYCTVARSDPDKGQPPCPDCKQYRIPNGFHEVDLRNPF